MAQYLIVYSTINPDYKRGAPSGSIKFDGVSATIVGPDKFVKDWSRKLSISSVLASSINDNKVDISSFVSTNTYVDMIFFDDDSASKSGDGKLKKLYDSISGSKRKITLERLPTFDDPDFTIEKRNAFLKKARKIKEQSRKK